MVSESIVPSYVGYLESTAEAILLFEGCFEGVIKYALLGPRDPEKSPLIKSGHIFIWQGIPSDLDDGIKWSRSRVIGNFLLYQELISSPKPDSSYSVKPTLKSNSATNEPTKPVTGSLSTPDTFKTKEGGLTKKIITLNVDGISYHLTSFYNIDDVRKNNLSVPSQDPKLKKLVPRHELLNQNFRAAINEPDPIEDVCTENQNVYGE